MKENQLKPVKGSVKTRTRKGRGNASGFGGECGRGHKGQKSRSGYSRMAGFEGGQMPLYKRIPKKRGFRNRFKVKNEVVNLDTISQFFGEKDDVTPESLYEKGLIDSVNNVKILSNGELKTTVAVIRAHKFSKAAVDKLESQKVKFEVIASA